MNPDIFNYKRRLTREVRIGNLNMGGLNPIRIQSMANTDTNDVENSLFQCISTFDAGAELMRFTTQGTREVQSLHQIHRILREKQYDIPLVADIHFNADAAGQAAKVVEKVRINPGNFISGIKRKSDKYDYKEEEFNEEFQLLKEKFISFLDICTQHKTAIRIGVNHGSLSERIVNRYGDTPEGMVASCMELLRLCREQRFHHVVISLKASNTVFMVYAVRMLVHEMDKEGFDYPIHLGVTEAGDGEDGRIKSAVGIGALLSDGIGDTIRVSLSEDPEYEIPVAKKLASYFEERENHAPIKGEIFNKKNWLEYSRRKTCSVKNIGGDNVPVVISTKEVNHFSLVPDYIFNEGKIADEKGKVYQIYTKRDIRQVVLSESEVTFLSLTFSDLSDDIFDFLSSHTNIVVIFNSVHLHKAGEARAFFYKLINAGCEAPVILHYKYEESEIEDLQIKAAADIGTLFIDGFGDGILLENSGNISASEINSIAFGILQASRMRISKTEYISCPGCGRTLFDLHKVISKVKSATTQFKGLKIAIMGCIVNGPGEMADADYGYVGAGKGKISLYRKKNCVEKNIPEDEAVEKLIELIKKQEKIK